MKRTGAMGVTTRVTQATRKDMILCNRPATTATKNITRAPFFSNRSFTFTSIVQKPQYLFFVQIVAMTAGWLLVHACDDDIRRNALREL